MCEFEANIVFLLLLDSRKSWLNHHYKFQSSCYCPNLWNTLQIAEIKTCNTVKEAHYSVFQIFFGEGLVRKTVRKCKNWITLKPNKQLEILTKLRLSKSAKHIVRNQEIWNWPQLRRSLEGRSLLWGRRLERRWFPETLSICRTSSDGLSSIRLWQQHDFRSSIL
jgi:hypothetical protein